MPDFHLTEKEAIALAAYINQSAKGTLKTFQPATSGNADRGKKIFSDARCDRCHQLSSNDRFAMPNVVSPFTSTPRQGCLAENTGEARKAPSFRWTEAERESVRVFLQGASQAKRLPDEPIEPSVPKILATLRCQACHSRDGSSAALPEIASEEGSGKAAETVPQLTWVGEKLQGPWIEQFLKGEIKQKPRPWLTARMPSFPDYAEMIAHGMANEHGVPFAEPAPTEFDPGRIEIGRRLTLQDGGLDCRQCHGLGKEQPRGDKGTLIALGINFTMTRERLRPEFALRQMLDPPRYETSSRMPRFAPDLKTTAAKQFDGGDAKKQFEAIKQYLWSVSPDE